MDLNNVKTQAIPIIKEAGEIAKKYFKTIDLESHSKGGVDFVTKADLEVDTFLQQKLAEAFPTTSFLTEETAPADVTSLRDAENLWVIDPIDGTTNFSRQDPHFAISVALVSKGQPLLGIVYLPEEEKLYTAIHNESVAYCNDSKITVSSIADIGQTSIAFDYSWDIDARKKMLLWVEQFAPVVRQPRSLGSAAADICKVAMGELDGYMICGIKPWDVAAAGLILIKAGGKITTPSGADWNIFDKDLVASNTLLHDKLLGFTTV